MNILISNDDGYRSEGIAVLAGALETIADIRVVAPDRDRRVRGNPERRQRRAEEHGGSGFFHAFCVGRPGPGLESAPRPLAAC